VLKCVVMLLMLGLVGPGIAQSWEIPVCAEPNSLPFSDRQAQGFENRIAEVIAEELGATLRYVWLPRPYSAARDVWLRNGTCDLILGITDGHPGFMTTLAYYRSSYMFVYRADSPFKVTSLDDPVLHELAIGVQVGRSGVSPGTHALVTRGLIENQVGLVPDYSETRPLAFLVEAVAEEQVDVAIVWGPVAGYFNERQSEPLDLERVTPEIVLPFIPMVASIAMGVRPGDEALRDRLNVAIVRRWDEIEAVLREYDVPLLPLPKPTLGGG
jgi:mxaJ protein